MKLVPISDGSFAMVDDRDFEMVSQYVWHKDGTGHIKRNRPTGDSLPSVMSNLILERSGSILVDHKDRNPMNNQRDNLRLATRSQNAANSNLSRRNKTGFKGVSVHDGKFRATIIKNRKQHWLGYFKTAQEAGSAYAKAAKELFGEFAHIP